MGKQKRILFLDQLKAISILLIVYGHNDYDSGFSAFVSTFRLPLFFMPRGAWGAMLLLVSFGYALGAWALCSGYKQVPPFLVTVCFYAGALQQRMKQEGGIGCV